MIPQKIHRLILNGPPLLTNEEKANLMSMIEKAPKMKPMKDGSHLIDLWERRKQFTPGWTDLDAMHRGIIQMLRVNGDEIHGFKAAFSQDLEKVLSAIDVPTMILTNTGDDIYFAAKRASLLRPDFLFLELQGGTHDIVDEQTDKWVESVCEFLQNS